MGNPIFKKEQKVRARSPKLMLLVFGYNAGLLLLMSIAFLAIYGVNPLESAAKYQDTLKLYVLIGIFQFALLTLIIPVFTASAITGEKERQTFDVLITTGRKPYSIVLGKLCASVSTMLLLLMSSLPIIAIVFSVGGLTITDILSYVMVCIVEAVFIGSIGMFFTSRSKNSTKSTVATYIVILMLIVGTIALLGVGYLIVNKQISHEVTSQFENAAVVDLKSAICILLLNPFITIVSLLLEQTGNESTFVMYMNRIGMSKPYILEHWVLISIVLQSAISTVLLYMSTRGVGKVKE